jgi:hypothetical protein
VRKKRLKYFQTMASAITKVLPEPVAILKQYLGQLSVVGSKVRLTPKLRARL